MYFSRPWHPSIPRLLTALLAAILVAATWACGQEPGRVDASVPGEVDWATVIDSRQQQDRSAPARVLGSLEWCGWASAGFTVNGHGNRTGHGNAPLPWNHVADTPLLNQLWLHAEKPLDLENRVWSWGFVVDYVFGADGPDNQAAGDRGWDFGCNTSRDYGSAIPQLYAQAGLGELEFLVGNFITPLGFEANQVVDNFFFSHNYGFGYGVPGIHSGALASYHLTESLQVDAGWTAGWDSSWSNHLDASTLLGGVCWTLTDAATVTYHCTAGDWGDGTAAGGAEGEAGTIYAHALIFSWDISSRLSYVLENTLGNNVGLAADNNRWHSLTHYAFYQWNDCWSAGGRFEWFRDEDGVRVAVNGAGAGDYYEATIGLNWQPTAGIRTRPELRWDWFSGEGCPFDRRDGGHSGTATEQFTMALDVIISI